MKTTTITELDLHDVPQVYHNLKYNDGEMSDYIPTDEDLQKSIDQIPKVNL